MRVLSRRSLESYLFDDEVLIALCESVGRPEEVEKLLADKEDAIKKSVDERGNPGDDIKSAAGEIYNAAKSRLGLTGAGNDAKAFMRSTLAPLIDGSMKVYQELKRDVFGD